MSTTKALDRESSSKVHGDIGRKKAGIHRKSIRGNKVVRGKEVYRPKMTVPVEKSFEQLQEMNEKALKILAKRA